MILDDLAARWGVLLATVLPWLAVAAALALGDRTRNAATVAVALVELAIVAALVPAAVAGRSGAVRLATLPGGVPFALRADALGVLFALLVAVLWVFATVYAAGYVAHEERRGHFFAAYAASVAAAVGVAFAANLLVLFVFYELLTLATYPLVVHFGTAEARAAGRTYLAYTFAGGVAVFGGTALVHQIAGTVAFVPGGVGLGSADAPAATAAFALLVVGFGVKTALVPFHRWLPEAMVAPTPVSALLHAVAVVKSGAFGVVRVVLFVFGPDAVREFGVGLPLATAAAATVIVSSVLTLRQDKLKRGLAYSTVGQLSYIVLGVALLAPAAVFGALLHLVAHGFMKITAFFSVGVVTHETGVDRVSGMDGVARRLPATTTAFAVAAAGLVGIPGVAGFVSKLYVLLGAFEAGRPLLATTVLLSGLLKLLFFWPIFARAGFRTDPVADGGEDDGREAAWSLLAPLLATAALAVLFGVRPSAFPFFALAERVVTDVLGDTAFDVGEVLARG
ncbi:complex I subunit 5 family protein [Halomicrococcus sp. NG-SE-24]|uniref:complex I subunit 5 family protein n=1 Tax=Halomicrococcus sp. NG-SE-24 TaxID=3436928 RepID=UPI003D95A3A3